MKPKWLSRRIAKPGPYLMLCISEAEYQAALKHLRVATDHQWMNSGADATCHHFTTGIGGASVVCLKAEADRDPIEVCGLLVHEAVHVWQEYASLMGEQHPGDEQEAYAVQSIAQDLMAEYARRVNGATEGRHPPRRIRKSARLLSVAPPKEEQCKTS